MQRCIFCSATAEEEMMLRCSLGGDDAAVLLGLVDADAAVLLGADDVDAAVLL